MNDFLLLLARNRNYRYTWTSQVVSEIGDHFNNIAVFSLAMDRTRSGMVVTGVMLSRAIPVMLAGPIAGVVLDRWDRRTVMIASDLARAVVAAAFLLTLVHPSNALLYVLSGLLMFASPFFTAGRSAILPAIASRDELHTANSLTQTTQWMTLTVGAFAAGNAVAFFGYPWAFVLNAASFVVSGLLVSRLRSGTGGFRAKRMSLTETDVARPWHEYREGLAYLSRSPLILGIALVGVGWATGGGAAQILFSLFGEVVFDRGPSGIGTIWACAGIGLVAGATLAHRLGPDLSFTGYKRAISFCYVLHGGAYILFSQAQSFALALVYIALSRAAVAVSSVLNVSQLLRHVPDQYRGRVFATNESLTWSTMMLSMAMAGIASQHHDPRVLGAWAGAASASTAIFWGWANVTGRLPEPATSGVDPDDIEVHGEVTI
ncbi:MAG TPA: MFS transporter [Vicinamibacteria bacterium]|nr:MFS transporter [Vicinamibacteria bacterium]